MIQIAESSRTRKHHVHAWTRKLTEGSKPKIMFHLVGLASLAGAVFLTLLTLYTIAYYGYVKAIEPNQLILIGEIYFAIYSGFYISYLFLNFFRQAVKQ